MADLGNFFIWLTLIHVPLRRRSRRACGANPTHRPHLERRTCGLCQFRTPPAGLCHSRIPLSKRPLRRPLRGHPRQPRPAYPLQIHRPLVRHGGLPPPLAFVLSGYSFFAVREEPAVSGAPGLVRHCGPGGRTGLLYGPDRDLREPLQTARIHAGRRTGHEPAPGPSVHADSSPNALPGIRRLCGPLCPLQWPPSSAGNPTKTGSAPQGAGRFSPGLPGHRPTPGRKWAYVVLGWGGYWGWDPVENAALLPWLTGTAFSTRS